MINSVHFILFCRVSREAISGARVVGAGQNWKGKVVTTTSSASCNPERQRGGAGLVGTYLRSRACNATSAPLRSGPFLFSSHASLPLLLQTWSHFYLFCLSYPLLFLASSFFSFLQVTKPLPFLASVQEHRDSLGTRSLAKHKLSVCPAAQQQRRSKPKGLATSLQDGAWPLERQAARQTEGRNVAIHPDPQDPTPL